MKIYGNVESYVNQSKNLLLVQILYICNRHNAILNGIMSLRSMKDVQESFLQKERLSVCFSPSVPIHKS